MRIFWDFFAVKFEFFLAIFFGLLMYLYLTAHIRLIIRVHRYSLTNFRSQKKVQGANSTLAKIEFFFFLNLDFWGFLEGRELGRAACDLDWYILLDGL